MDILVGLNMAAVRRLKDTWKALSNRTIDEFLDLQKSVSSDDNYSNYRRELAEAKLNRVTLVPHLGVYLRDLVFIHEGNEDFIHFNQINYRKMTLISAVFNDIRAFQENEEYTFKIIPKLQQFLLFDRDVLSDSEIASNSRYAEAGSQRTRSLLK